MIELDTKEQASFEAGILTDHHRDLSDRMLVAPAQAKGLIIITKDKNLPLYGVRLINVHK